MVPKRQAIVAMVAIGFGLTLGPSQEYYYP